MNSKGFPVSFKIESFGPQHIQAGDTFLPQSNGDNVLWVKVNQKVSKFANVLFDGVPLRPDISDDALLLTVRLAPEATMLPGAHKIMIHDASINLTSSCVYLEVKETRNSLELVNKIHKKLLEFHSQKLLFPETFRGWGLASQHTLPWQHDPSFQNHLSTMNAFIKNEFFHGKENFLDKNYVDELRWRHAILFYWARYAAIRAKSRGEHMCMVEAGVGDGKTTFSLLTGAKTVTSHFKAFLYDAWTTIDSEQLDLREMRSKNSYDDLSIEMTKLNLKQFEAHTHFVPGRLPEILKNFESLMDSKEALYLVHIDLNVAEPSRAVMEILWPLMAPSGVFIFDDYGWENHQATRDALAPQIQSNESCFMMLPTGQALLIKT